VGTILPIHSDSAAHNSGLSRTGRECKWAESTLNPQIRLVRNLLLVRMIGNDVTIVYEIPGY